MEIKDTLLMPKTAFEMRGNLAQKEPNILIRWEQAKLYEKILGLKVDQSFRHTAL